MAVPSKKGSTRRSKKSKESSILTDTAAASPSPTDDNLGHLLQTPADVAFSATPVGSPNNRFFLRHWPREWEVEDVDGTPCWLPILAPHILRPGTGNIRTLSPHEAHQPHRAFETAVMDARREGWIYIDPQAPVEGDCLPDGVPAGGYLRSMDVVTKGGVNGTRWLDAWTVPVKTLPGEKQKWKFHRNLYNKWRKGLVDAGPIEPPDIDVKKRVFAKLQRHISRNRAKPLPADLRAERVGVIEKRLERAEQATVPGQ